MDTHEPELVHALILRDSRRLIEMSVVNRELARVTRERAAESVERAKTLIARPARLARSTSKFV